ncbi:MAG: NADH-quinone oxidoreductase subunit NuoN [Geodermatophilaceae bacterium]|nr:NADH-quinone oxidoreductase subunit NuoN [Geodermatophilaceae bacterium]
MPVQSPSVSYTGLAPVLFLLGAALIGVLVEAFVPRAYRWATQLVLAGGGCVGALVSAGVLAGRQELTVSRAVAIDGPALFIEGTLALLGLLSILLMAERSPDMGGSAFVAQAAVPAGTMRDRQMATMARSQTEIFPLATFALGGMMLFSAANNLLVMFIALEVLSLPLYLLCGLARRRRLLSQEAALKYFLLGAFTSAFFLYGLALLYGYAGTVDLRGIYEQSAGTDKSDTLFVIGLAFLIVGLLFKAGVAPFHTWTPDVYQGAPTSITAFMASCTKVAAFGAILRVLYVGFGSNDWTWRPVLYAVAIVTLVVGAVLALTQTDVKRMLAYSSIAHAGFILTGALANDAQGLSSTLFYLLTYGVTTIGSFAVVMLVRDADGEAGHLSQWAGLAKRSPLVAAVFALFLLALAGIPLTSGFTGKFVVFRAALDAGLGPLVVIALVASAVAAFFYLRVIVLMYFSEPAQDGPTVAVPGLLTTVVLAVSAAGTVLLGVFPSAVLDLAERAAQFAG